MSDPGPTIQKSDDVGSPNPVLIRLLQTLGAAIGILWIVWVTTVLCFLRYVPSHQWLQAIEPYYTVIVTAAVVITAVFLFLSFQTGTLQRAQRQNESTVIAILVIPFLVYFPSAEFMRRGIPAMIAVGWGEQVEHQFYVLDPDKRHHGRTRCRREIVLRDMNFTTMLCNMPSAFHDQLQAGTSVVFIGKGTWMGLFVEDFRKP